MSEIIRHNGQGAVRLKTHHDPSRVGVYGVIWDKFLKSGEVIEKSTWTVGPSYNKESETFPGPMRIGGVDYQQVATITLSGGTLDEAEQHTCEIETDQGRTEPRSFLLFCGAN